MNFIANIYIFLFGTIFPVILLLLSIFFLVLIFNSWSCERNTIANKILGKSRTRVIITYLLLFFMIIFSNFDMFALFGGSDIRFMSDGRYCYNVEISRNYGDNTYTLPASIYKETNGFGKSKYYIEKVFFKNGGYLVFDEEDYIALNDYNYLVDQNGEEWTVKLSNQHANHKDVSESKPISFWGVVLALFESIALSLFTLLHLPNIKGNTKAFRKNSERLFNILSELIDNYEDQFKPSCKDDISKILIQKIEAAKEEISEWKDFDTDYIRIAHSMLANTSFEMLVSGKYHIYAGHLNPMSCAHNLMLIYNKSMDYAVKINEINLETQEAEYELLQKQISTIG